MGSAEGVVLLAEVGGLLAAVMQGAIYAIDSHCYSCLTAEGIPNVNGLLAWVGVNL